MSYSIVYDRRFIAVGEKFIPLFQAGSNNCFGHGSRGQLIPEKNWSVFNHTMPHKILFTGEEIKELSKAYDDAEFFKTRNTPFEKDEFIRWFENGINNAQTIEYYSSYGNAIYVSESHKSGESKPLLVSTTEELLSIIEKNEIKNLFEKSYRLIIRFNCRDLFLPKQKRIRKEKKEYPFYFVLVSSGGNVFSKKTKNGYRYTYYKDCSSAKRFKTETEAKRYLEKYSSIKNKFSISKVEQPGYI